MLFWKNKINERIVVKDMDIVRLINFSLLLFLRILEWSCGEVYGGGGGGGGGGVTRSERVLDGDRGH